MHTVDGMLETTRRIFGEEQPMDHHHLELSKRLDQTGADSYLRKLCVSCHLGNERRKHGQSLKDRGGGCVACHLEYPQNSEKIVHPRLTVEVDNRRCFGCHSRSGRISLNYLGLAEVEEPIREGSRILVGFRTAGWWNAKRRTCTAWQEWPASTATLHAS